MKVVLATLNSKFIHSNLAIRYLKSYVEDIIPIELMEFTINQNINYIASEIYKSKPEILGLSTYIWNLEETMQVAEIIKIVSPDTKILLGGPEVSFEGEDILKQYSFIDYIIYGEGEETFREYILALLNGNNLQDVLGLIYRDDNIIKNSPRPLIKDMDTIPSPYNVISEEFKNRIVYYESSRGCPFNCEFCLSSTIKGVRYLPIERVKRDIENLINSKVSQVKFVDRTFNANKKYAMEIMKFIMEKDPTDINFHFEVTAHLIDNQMLEFIKTCKEGLFQFEIGVQSTNPKTIDAIGRITDFNKLKEICIKIKSFDNIHQHLDLIAGLPYENYCSFRNSFNDVYSIRPEKLQLGFLKLLKGSGLRLNEKKYNYKYKYLNKPPYEVLENNYLKHHEIIKLREIEDLVEKYYNEEYFLNSLEYIIKNLYETPFDFYEDFANYWVENKLDKTSHSRQNLYNILIDFYLTRNFNNKELFEEIVKFDYIENNRNLNYPVINNLKNLGISQVRLHEILKDTIIIQKYLDKDLPTKKLIKNVIVEGFKYDILKLIENNYDVINNDNEIKYILFKFSNSKIIRCNTFDITNIVRG